MPEHRPSGRRIRPRRASNLAHIGLWLTALFANACAVNPISGQRDLVLTSTASERKAGAQEARKVQAEMGFVDMPQLTAYVSAVGKRLVGQFDNGDVAFEFHVVDMEEPNAFALPGGFVYVSRGLLALVNSEDELAGVIGHEIGHVVARHASRRVTLAAPFAIVTGVTALATSIVSPTLGNVVAGVGHLTGGLVLAPYSREQEREADRLGIELAGRGGWDPGALSQFLSTLQREETLRQGTPRPYSFFASHPSTPERVADTAAEAQTVARANAAPIARDRAALLERLDGLIIGDDPAAGVFDDQRFLQPALNFTLQYPEGWKTDNARSYVAAVAEGGDALAVLRVHSEGTDPSLAAAAVAREVHADAGAVQKGSIGGLPSAHLQAQARTDGGTVAVDLTWVAHGGRIYELVGATAPSRLEKYRKDFAAIAGSFRALTADERAAIKEVRLRSVAARVGERLAALLARARSRWNVDEAAVANGMARDAVLQAGQLVKAAVPQPFTPRASTTTD